MIRYTIIQSLEIQASTNNLPEFESKLPGINMWLQGCIDGLYYRPNKYLLIIPERIELIEFNARDIYDSLTWEIEYCYSQHLLLPMCDDFKIDDNGANKRLASYYTIGISSEWRHPLRKTHIMIHTVEHLKHIPKIELWREIYQKYKPVGK